MKKRITVVAAALMSFALMAGCSNGGMEGAETAEGSSAENGQMAANSAGYSKATAEEAKAMMDSEKDYLILDVRTQDEYADGHVPGATLIPLDELGVRAERELTDKDQLILVYCRSGNRSQQAAESLAQLGYTNVVDFGGINSWPYEIEK